MITYKETTISQYITNYKRDPITYSSLSFKEILKNNKVSMIVSSYSILDKYLPLLEPNKVIITLDTPQLSTYKYNPKLLSYDIYGTTELWAIILQANEMTSVTEFILDKFYIYDSVTLKKLINEVMTVEKPFIDINNAEINKG